MTHSAIRTGRAVGVLLAVVQVTAVAGNAAVAQTQSDEVAAKEALDAGRRHFRNASYLAALRAFRRSYTLREQFPVLCHIARCHERLGRAVAASMYYRRCLTRGGAKSARAARIKAALRKVNARIAVVTIQSPGPKPARAFVDGKPVGKTPVEVPMAPGLHEIGIQGASAKTPVTVIKVAAGDRTEVVLGAGGAGGPLPAPLRKSPPLDGTDTAGSDRRDGVSPIWFWAGASITASLAIAATILGALALRANADYEDEPTDFGYRRVLDRRLMTNVAWGLTAGFAATTATLFFFTDFRASPAAGDSQERAYLVGVRGTF